MSEFWLCFVPLLGTCAVMFFSGTSGDSTAMTVAYRVVGSGLAILFAWCLYRGTRNFVRARRAARLSPEGRDDPDDEPGGGAPPPDAPAPPST